MRDPDSGRPLYAGLERQLVRANPTSRACARRSRLHSRPTFLALIPFSMHWPRTRRTRSSSRPARCPSPCCQPTTASAQSCASRPPKMTRLARATGLTLGAAGMPCQVSGDGRQRDDPAHRYAAAQTPKPSVQSLNRPLLAAVPHRRLSHGACGLERGAGGSVLAVPWARRPAAANRPRGLGHVVLRRQVAPIPYARTCVSRGRIRCACPPATDWSRADGPTAAQDEAIAAIVEFAGKHPTQPILLECEMIGYEPLWRAIFTAFRQKVCTYDFAGSACRSG